MLLILLVFQELLSEDENLQSNDTAYMCIAIVSFVISVIFCCCCSVGFINVKIRDLVSFDSSSPAQGLFRMMFMYLLGIPMVLWCYVILILWWVATKWDVKQYKSGQEIQILVYILQVLIGFVMLGIVIMISYVAIRWLFKHCMIIKEGFGPCKTMTTTETCVSTQGHLCTCVACTLLPIGLIAFIAIFFLFLGTIIDLMGAGGGSGFSFGAMFSALGYICCFGCIGWCLTKYGGEDCGNILGGLCCCIVIIYVVVSIIQSSPEVIGWLILICCCLAYAYRDED